MELAIGDDTRLKASNIEFDLPQPNYTVDTLVYLREKFPKNNFALIMGADNLNHFHKWKNHEVILENHELYVYPRMDSNEGGDLKRHYKVNYVEAPVMKVSSSFIRKSIKDGRNLRHYMPSKVSEYVAEMNLYKTDSTLSILYHNGQLKLKLNFFLYSKHSRFSFIRNKTCSLKIR